MTLRATVLGWPLRVRVAAGVGAVAVVLLVVWAVAVVGGDGDGGGEGTASAVSGGDGSGVATFRMGASGLESLDPADVVLTDQAAMQVADLLFDGLVAPGATAEDPVRPALAASWTVDEAGTTWRFVLDGDRRFSDGSPVTAADVAFTLERLAKRGSTSVAGVRLEVLDGYSSYLDGSAPSISGVVIVDEQTLELRTRVAYQPLPALMASPAYGVVPRGAVEADPEGFLRSPVTSGAWTLEGWDGPVIRLVEVTGGGGGAGSGGEGGAAGAGAGGGDSAAVGVDVVEVHVFADGAAAWEAFEAGELDWAQVPAIEIAGATEEMGGRVVASPFAAELFLAFNLSSPAVADLRMREAVVAAVDREAVAGLVPGGIPLDGVLVEGVPGFEAAVGGPCGERCAHDPERARRLVEEIRAEREVPEVIVDFYEGGAEEAIAEAVVADLAAAGIPAAVRIRPFEEYRAFVVGEEAQVFGFGWVGVAADAESYLGPTFESTSPANVTGLSMVEVDDTIREARAATDPEWRGLAYLGVEQAVMAQLPIVPLVQLRTFVAVSERVDGYAQRLDGCFDVQSLVLPS